MGFRDQVLGVVGSEGCKYNSEGCKYLMATGNPLKSRRPQPSVLQGGSTKCHIVTPPSPP